MKAVLSENSLLPIPVIRQRMISTSLAGQGVAVVGTATDCRGTADLVRFLLPDAVIVVADDAAPDRLPDGIELTRSIVAQSAPVRPRILLVAEAPDSSWVSDAMQAGALGWVPGSATPAELAAAARAVSLGHTVVGAMADDGARQIAAEHDGPEPRRPRPPGGLTRREQEVFELMAVGHTPRQIAQELVLGENTVRSHIQHIYRKLQLRSQVELVIFAYESGLVS